MSNFVQKVFNQISLQKDQRLWMSEDESLLERRFHLLAQFPETQFAAQLKLESASGCKNSCLSTALREKGNLCYAQGDLDRALILYNQSLQFAKMPAGHRDEEEDEEEEEERQLMALAYANRSAIWMDRKEYELALRDVELAFQVNYPDDLRYKLLERKGRCLQSLGQPDLAQHNFRLAINSLQTTSTLTGERKKSKMKCLEALIQDLRPPDSNNNDGNGNGGGNGGGGIDGHLHDGGKGGSGSVRKFIRDLKPKLPHPHSRFPSFCDSVEVRYGGPERGRYCVAGKQIECGELMAVETPFVWMLDKEESRNHCWHCFRPVLSPVPCFECSGVLFCGPDCRQEATDSYHRYECGLVDVIYRAQIGGWALAYRAVVSHDLDFFLSRKQLFEKRNERMGSSEEDGDQMVYSSEDIFAFHNLVSHDGRSEKSAPELMMQATAALFLLRCLAAKKYYVRRPAADDDDGPVSAQQLSGVEMFLAKLLHHFMRVAYYNTHEVTTVVDLVSGQHHDFNFIDPERLKMKRIGRATNTTLALINHSCDPNYRRINVGRFTLGFATKTIAPGQEICDTYCPTFAAMSRDQRAGQLKKYNFVCGCCACRDDWPMLDQLPDKFHGLPAHCYLLNTKDEIRLQMKRISTADHLVAKLIRAEPAEQVDLNRLLKMVQRHYTEIGKLVRPPHRALVMAENKLYHILLAIFASKSDVHYAI